MDDLPQLQAADRWGDSVGRLFAFQRNLLL